MAFLSSLDISGSALTASRLRMDVISENIANASTTRTDAGGPYRRKMVVYRAADSEEDSFGSLLNNELGDSTKAPGGVKVDGIVEDQTPFTTVYDPSSPDADAQGYVQKPNVDVTKETLDMMSVTRAYSANINALNAVKSMAGKALEIWK
ncbi:Flagellar basal-body rod protein FlgC [Caprobacter fermentans]|uniref:Flagellar basal-body rod protein FlgC n=1 Tax=Caproicibacter fermentans TaxID=2576756 RepID=A0A6N8HVB2_9FIRM|nr:flagellar basal body rod protein FlgC [Caproicibacter fermentans]MVB09731.1 Flagellar basal-body rod protein FlgC [Caproicibacter fermentans]OCN03139.1 flagellar basal body rod protein FlgC [Clostridium sp. W14A]QNK42383.1 flagellar basal body rod protein FlgC [Caproicibacter fermentans]